MLIFKCGNLSALFQKHEIATETQNAQKFSQSKGLFFYSVKICVSVAKNIFFFHTGSYKHTRIFYNVIPRYYTSKSPVSYLDTPFERGIRGLHSLARNEWHSQL